ncbi:unnamed protein product [Oncorhynchus mykiss]|uniref:ALMS motif domain-containing protein n=1 Tax=Oncorhynchus mykiss TaxID=8022 RepID=A0A060YE13_ONCMY|nr:unnamed protein product [Oncorhynchus mykiss]
MAGFGMGGNKKTGSSSSRHSSCRGVSGTILDSLIHGSSIQRIIDKYTRELNFSLSTAGNQMGTHTISLFLIIVSYSSEFPNGSLLQFPFSYSSSSHPGPSAVLEGSVCEEPSSSVSQQKPWSKLLQENEGPERSPVWEADPHSPPSDRESGAQGQDQEWDNTVNRIMDRLSDKSSSLVLDQWRDSTFSPMTGQPSDKSSSPGQGWDSTLSRMIGQLSGQSTSLDHGWDSTLSRMIGGLSNQSISVSQRLDQSSQWLDEVQDESRVMRPLAGELDESAAQWSGSSEAGGSNSRGWVDLRVSGQTGVFSDPEGASESQLLSSSSLPGREPPHYQSLQHSGACSQEEDRTGVDPASDSFHPLLAEVTHNETAEPFMTFHLPEEEVEGLCSHDEDGDHEAPAGDLELSACSEEFEDDTDPSVTSEMSPERLRGAEEPPQPSPALHDSLYQLTISQCLPHDSALQVSPGAEEVGLAACEDVSTLDMPLEGGDTDMESTPTPQRLDKRGAIKIEDLDAGEPDDQLCSESKIRPPIWERIMEVGSVKGIMDESMLTLVSLTDTTLQGQELTEEGEMEESKSTMLPEEDASLQEKETTPSHAVMLLEFQSCPSVNLQEAFQQKRSALIQRSARRVEEIQAKRDEARANTITRDQSDPTTVQSTTFKPRREGRSAESTHAGGYAKQKKQQPKPQTPLQPPMLAKLKKVGEVRISTPEIRKQDVAEMHKRTERLYSRLDEVKLQKEVRTRQEAYANNREKAKEFHKKTLQKLRAKQSSQ